VRIFRGLVKVAAVALLVVFVLVHFTPLVPWYARKLAGDWTDADGDILIALSSDLEADGVLGYNSYLRTLYAVRAYRGHPFTLVVFSGGRDPNGPVSNAEAMAEFAIAYGVPRDRILLQDRSTTTHEDALFTAALLKDRPGKKVLLTSDYHMFRSRSVFEKAGLHVIPRPFPDTLKRFNSFPQRWGCFCGLAIETTKIIYYKLHGWI
jgi:uncharacterized SAM-binding protein YcdF (DUF218 family)